MAWVGARRIVSVPTLLTTIGIFQSIPFVAAINTINDNFVAGKLNSRAAKPV